MPLSRLPLPLSFATKATSTSASSSATCPLRCDTWSRAKLLGIRTRLNPRDTSQQRRVLTNLVANQPSTRPLLAAPRSPHQWSHLVHHIRRPPSTSSAMAAAKIGSGLAQVRTHMGHSHGHGHHHHHDNTYLTSGNKNDPGVRITRVGLYVNLGMAIVKGAGGYVFNSKALIADAVHALTDLVSDITTLATISYSLRPATTRFPLGYGKIESVGALAVSMILLTGGIAIGLEGVLALSQQFFPEVAEFLSHNIGILAHSHSHSHVDHDHGHAAATAGPHIQAAWLAAGSIVVKEWLYRATMKVAKEKRSSVLASNAYHHRVDSLTAFVALFTILASHVMEGARWLDPVGGLIISGMIIQAGWMNTKSALFELADAGVEDEVRESAQNAAMAAVEGLGAEIRGVQGLKSGQNLMFEIEVGVPEEWTIARASEIEAELREKVATSVRGTKRVVVRFTTQNVTPFLDQFVSVKENDAIEHDHHHHHDEHEHEHEHKHSDGHSVTSSRQQDAAQKRR